MKLLFGIYKITNKVNGKVYIGSTTRSFYQRWHLHKTNLKRGNHHCGHLQNAWNKYGQDNFEFDILQSFSKEDFPDIGTKELNIKILEIEQLYLDTHKDKYNTLEIAGSSLGSKHTDEAKSKISKAKKGKCAHPNTLEAIKTANTGKKRSPEVCEAVRKAQKGRIKSIQERENISKGHERRRNERKGS